MNVRPLSDRTRAVLCTLVLLAVTLAVWHGTLAVPFHFDDVQVVQYAGEIRDLGNLPSFLSPADGLFRRGLLKAGLALNYVAASKDRQGSPDPAGFHAVNLALHAINVLFLYLLVCAVFRRKTGRPSDGLSLAVAILYAVLPIHTSSVNLIFNRAVLQMSLFALLALLCWLPLLDASRSTRSRILLGTLGLLFVAASAASKAEGVAAAALFLFIAWGTSPIPFRPLSTPLGKGVALSSVPALLLIGFLLVRSGQVWQGGYHGIVPHLLTQAGVILLYLQRTLVPVGLNIDPEVPLVVSPTLSSLAACAVCLGLAGLSVVLLRRRALEGLGLAWFLVALLPTSSVIPRVDLMMEYRVYLASAGLVLVVVLLATRLEAALRRRSLPAWVPRGATVGLLVIVLLSGSIVTMQRNRLFANPVALWTETAERSPGKARVWFNLANALQDARRYDEAVAAADRQLALDRTNPAGFFRRGLSWFRKGTVGRARSDFDTALRLNPDHGFALLYRGILRKDLGDLEGALQDLDRSLGLDPSHAPALNSRGIVHLLRHDPTRALRDFNDALSLSPDEAEYLNNRGLARKLAGDPDGARKDFDAAIRASPAFDRAYFNRGTLRREFGDPEGARQDWNSVLRLAAPGSSLHTEAATRLKNLPP